MCLYFFSIVFYSLVLYSHVSATVPILLTRVQLFRRNIVHRYGVLLYYYKSSSSRPLLVVILYFPLEYTIITRRTVIYTGRVKVSYFKHFICTYLFWIFHFAGIFFRVRFKF